MTNKKAEMNFSNRSVSNDLHHDSYENEERAINSDSEISISQGSTSSESEREIMGKNRRVQNQNEDTNLNSELNENTIKSSQSNSNDSANNPNSSDESTTKILLTLLREHCTFSFSFFFFINTVFYLLMTLDLINPFNYTYFDKGLTNKHQYYRLFTMSFTHFNIMFYVINMYFFYIYVNCLERKLGSMYTLMYVFYSCIISNITFNFFNYVVKTVFGLFFDVRSSDYVSGFNGVIFSIFVIYWELIGRDTFQTYVGLNPIRSGRIVYILLYIVTALNPHSSILLSVSGIATAHLIINFVKVILFPPIEWISHTENLFNDFLSNLNLHITYIKIADIDQSDLNILLKGKFSFKCLYRSNK